MQVIDLAGLYGACSKKVGMVTVSVRSLLVGNGQRVLGLIFPHLELPYVAFFGQIRGVSHRRWPFMM